MAELIAQLAKENEELKTGRADDKAEINALKAHILILKKTRNTQHERSQKAGKIPIIKETADSESDLA